MLGTLHGHEPEPDSCGASSNYAKSVSSETAEEDCYSRRCSEEKSMSTLAKSKQQGTQKDW